MSASLDGSSQNMRIRGACNIYSYFSYLYIIFFLFSGKFFSLHAKCYDLGFQNLFGEKTLSEGILSCYTGASMAILRLLFSVASLPYTNTLLSVPFILHFQIIQKSQESSCRSNSILDSLWNNQIFFSLPWNALVDNFSDNLPVNL